MTQPEQKKMYFGPAEVTMVVSLNDKTKSGDEILKVYLDRKIQPYEIIPKTSFEKLVSLEPIQDTAFQEKRYKVILDQFIEILLENGIIYADIPYVCKTLHARLSTSYERATNFLWTQNDEEFIAGIHELGNRSLIEADIILKKIKNNVTDPQQTDTSK